MLSAKHATLEQFAPPASAGKFKLSFYTHSPDQDKWFTPG